MQPAAFFDLNPWFVLRLTSCNWRGSDLCLALCGSVSGIACLLKTNVAPKTTVALSPIEPHWYGLTGEPSQCLRIEGQPLLCQVYCLQFFQCLFGYCCQIDPYKLWTARHQLVLAMAYGVMAYIYLSEEGEPISFQILIWFVLHEACIDHLEIIKNDKPNFATIFQARKPKRPTGSQIKNFVQYHTYKIKVKAFTKSKTIVLLNLDLFRPSIP